MDVTEETKMNSFIQWEEEWWKAIESNCLTDFQSSEFTSGGVLAVLIGNTLYEHPEAVVEYV